MFAGLCTNSAFFKERVNLFVALAPVCWVDACGSEMIQTMAKNKEAISLALKMEFDNLMPHAGSSNRVTGLGMYVMNVGAVAFGKISIWFPARWVQLAWTTSWAITQQVDHIVKLCTLDSQFLTKHFKSMTLVQWKTWENMVILKHVFTISVKFKASLSLLSAASVIYFHLLSTTNGFTTN